MARLGMSTTDKIIECCGRVLWTERVIDHDDGKIEAYLILPNGLVATEIHAACAICRREWHFSGPADIRLRRILARSVL